MWLLRENSGYGRASRNPWNKGVGPAFSEEMDKHRRWNFGLPDTFDVVIWDLEPGEPFPHLYNVIQQVSHSKAFGLPVHNFARLTCNDNC